MDRLRPRAGQHERQQLQGQHAKGRVPPPEPGRRHAACVVRRNMKWIPNALALAMVLFGPAASAQSCPPSEFGKSCGPFGSPFPGLPQWVGVCIASTCSSENQDDGAVSRQPCGFCEPVACPVPEVGQPCDAGTCTQATCRGTDDAGNPTSQTCGVCIVPILGCSSANLGAPCGDGGTCMTGTVRAPGPAGAAPPSDLFYSTPQCVRPPKRAGRGRSRRRREHRGNVPCSRRCCTSPCCGRE